ncbi:hypothetical protein ANO14919_012410 [Xylariales sp. No.14919]|nr:hypothetical protein ANO14919_012410 [Xylariales sp. No.14919]
MRIALIREWERFPWNVFSKELAKWFSARPQSVFEESPGRHIISYPSEEFVSRPSVFVLPFKARKQAFSSHGQLESLRDAMQGTNRLSKISDLKLGHQESKSRWTITLWYPDTPGTAQE